MDINSNLFGIYLHSKRNEKGFTLRELSEVAGISHVYLYKMECGKKPPPNDALLIKMALCLQLNNDEKDLFFDIAATTKQLSNSKNHQLPADIKLYLFKTKEAQKFVREASKINLSDDYWKELLSCLKNL